METARHKHGPDCKPIDVYVEESIAAIANALNEAGVEMNAGTMLAMFAMTLGGMANDLHFCEHDVAELVTAFFNNPDDKFDLAGAAQILQEKLKAS